MNQEYAPRQSRREEEVVEDVKGIEVNELEVSIDAIDKLLEEIDDVLEKNAAEFAENYVQKGGQ